jgi:hypothetical protein
MKNILFLLSFLVTSVALGQTRYWTSYNFSVDAKNEAAVYKLVDDYFKANPTSDDVNAYLYENHFKDHGNNYSHSFIWAGTLDGMGSQYTPRQDKDWELLLTKLNQLIDKSHSATMGNTVVNIGENKPIQRYFYLDVEDPQRYLAAFNKYQKYRPKDRQVLLGGFSAGRSPDGETHWIIIGFDDMKSAMDPGAYRRNNAQAQKAWDEYRKNRGETRMVRNGLRIMLGSW